MKYKYILLSMITFGLQAEYYSQLSIKETDGFFSVGNEILNDKENSIENEITPILKEEAVVDWKSFLNNNCGQSVVTNEDVVNAVQNGGVYCESKVFPQEKIVNLGIDNIDRIYFYPIWGTSSTVGGKTTYEFNGDLSIFEGVKDIDFLDIYYLGLSNLEPLKYLNKARVISLMGNEITDLSHLSNVKGLEDLFLSDNPIDSSGMNGVDYSNLAWLKIANTNISNLSFLSSTKKIRSINIENTNITSLSPLSNNSGAINFELYANNSPILNFEGLNKLDNFLRIYNNNNSNLKSLKGLENSNRISILDVRNSYNLNDISQLSNLNDSYLIYLPIKNYDFKINKDSWLCNSGFSFLYGFNLSNKSYVCEI